MSTEIEVKLMLLTPQPQIIDHFLTTNNITCLTRTVVQLDNRYFDTKEQTLYRHGIALRVRRTNNSYEMTIKTKASKNGGIHIHPEYNIPLANDVAIPDLNAFPAEIFTNVDRAVLQPQIYCNMGQQCQRKSFLVAYPTSDNVIEISYDEVTYQTPTAPIQSYEVEFELKDGSVQALEQLVKLFVEFAGDGVVRIGTVSKMFRAAIYAQIASVPLALVSNSTQLDDLLTNFEELEREFLLQPTNVALTKLHTITSKLSNLMPVFTGLVKACNANDSCMCKDAQQVQQAVVTRVQQALADTSLVNARLTLNFAKMLKEKL